MYTNSDVFMIIYTKNNNTISDITRTLYSTFRFDRTTTYSYNTIMIIVIIEYNVYLQSFCNSLNDFFTHRTIYVT